MVKLTWNPETKSLVDEMGSSPGEEAATARTGALRLLKMQRMSKATKTRPQNAPSQSIPSLTQMSAAKSEKKGSPTLHPMGTPPDWLQKTPRMMLVGSREKSLALKGQSPSTSKKK